MYANISLPVSMVQLENLNLPHIYVYPTLIITTLLYMVTMFCNMMVLLSIACCKELHQPMFILLFSLPISDMIGTTAFLPQLLWSIVTQYRSIPYTACITQAFLIHIYGMGNLLILSIMAYDRYTAICFPLRYNEIMSPLTLVKMILLVVFLLACLPGLDPACPQRFDPACLLLFVLQMRLPHCKSVIMNVFCDNPSLLKLTCANTTINNVVGLFNTAVIQAVSLSVQAFSYVKILIACMVSRRSEAKMKAINTCVAQLMILAIFEFVATFTILSHRFNTVSADLQKIMGMLIFLIPPLLNPIVYGLYTGEIRNAPLRIIKKRSISV
uniref:Olfactory receptor n=1 Tax=Takifugu rubripes TaxID=31033 RepID=A0A674MK00_TAKRU